MNEEEIKMNKPILVCSTVMFHNGKPFEGSIISQCHCCIIDIYISPSTLKNYKIEEIDATCFDCFKKLKKEKEIKFSDTPIPGQMEEIEKVIGKRISYEDALKLTEKYL